VHAGDLLLVGGEVFDRREGLPGFKLFRRPLPGSPALPPSGSRIRGCPPAIHTPQHAPPPSPPLPRRAGNSSLALLASAVGAIVFGHIADKLGRRKIYGYEVLVLAPGALASAFAPGIWWLIGLRAVLGFGIGGTTRSARRS